MRKIKLDVTYSNQHNRFLIVVLHEGASIFVAERRKDSGNYKYVVTDNLYVPKSFTKSQVAKTFALCNNLRKVANKTRLMPDKKEVVTL
jgi:hypothetical protein